MHLLKERKSFKAFLDSSVIVAAVLSSRGGSFRLFQEVKSKKIRIFISPFVFTEVVRALQKKYPKKISSFYTLITTIPINFVKDASSKSVAALIKFIHPEDAPVLASALKSRSQFLITLDRKHFFTSAIRKANLPIEIITPKDFFQKHWRK